MGSAELCQQCLYLAVPTEPSIQVIEDTWKLVVLRIQPERVEEVIDMSHGEALNALFCSPCGGTRRACEFTERPGVVVRTDVVLDRLPPRLILGSDYGWFAGFTKKGAAREKVRVPNDSWNVMKV